MVKDKLRDALFQSVNKNYEKDFFSSTCTSTHSSEPEKPLTKELIDDMIRLLEEMDPWQKLAKQHGYDLNAGDVMMIPTTLAEGRILRENVIPSHGVPADEIYFMKGSALKWPLSIF